MSTLRSHATLLAWFWSGHVRSQPASGIVSIIAIAIGVALALAIHLVNRSALAEFGAALAMVNGEAQAQLRAGAGTIDEEIFAAVARDPRVAVASPVIETDLSLVHAPGEQNAASVTASGTALPRSLRVLAIDPLRAAAVTPGLIPVADAAGGGAPALFSDDAIFLSQAAASALGLRSGATLHARAGIAPVELRVAGRVAGAGPDQLIAVMDIGTAQWRLGWLGRISRIDLRLAAGADAARLRADLLLAHPQLVWSAPQADEQRMSNLSQAYRVNLNVLALVALFTGAFIVYTSIGLGVVRQQQELALLGVLGTPGRTLFAAVLGQGAVLGMLGAALGVAAGIGLAAVVLAAVGGDLGGGFFAGSRPALVVEPLAVTVFAALGITVGVAGSLVPALRIAAMAPARALRAGSSEETLSRGTDLRVALVLALAGTALLALPAVGGLPIAAYVAIGCWLTAGIACVRPLVRLVVRAAAGTGRAAWRQPTLWLALQRVRHTPASASAALAGVVASFALASSMAIMVHSFRGSVDNWLDAVLPADLYTRSASGAANAGLTPELRAQLASAAGVARIEFLRALQMTLDPTRPAVILLARTLDAAAPHRTLPLTGTVLRAPPGTVPIYVSEAMVDLYGFVAGSTVSLPLGPPGERFFVAAVWRDYARQHGAITVSHDDYRRLTGDATSNDVAVWLTAGTAPTEAIAAIRRLSPVFEELDWRSAREIRAISLGIFDRSFAVSYLLVAVAILVGLFGVAAAYAGEALARAREFGMLRHLGVTRRQVAGIFAAEAAAMVTIGVAWGAMLGAAIAMVLIHRVNPQSFHWTMDTTWPTELLAGTAAALVATGIAAAVLAARSATGQGPVHSVREDW